MAEQIDSHRKKQLADYPKLTLTGIYNVLDKLRAGETLSRKEKATYDQGLVGVLSELHNELDAAVATAYGWPADLSDEQILEHLLALNVERAAEERAGLIRWLRPSYQKPDGADQTQQAEAVLETQTATDTIIRVKLPANLPARFASVRSTLSKLPLGGDVEAVAEQFHGAKRKTITEILDTLVGLGQITRDATGNYAL